MLPTMPLIKSHERATMPPPFPDMSMRMRFPFLFGGQGGGIEQNKNGLKWEFTSLIQVTLYALIESLKA